MDSLLIKGGVPLHGDVKISGAKNAVLPIMASTLLTDQSCVIRRVPDLSDVQFMAKILSSLGAKVEVDGDTVTVRASKLRPVGNYELIRKMRGSICILGPLLGRQRQAKVSLPGGCVIGTRPIDLHLKGLRDLGAKIDRTKNNLTVRRNGQLQPVDITTMPYSGFPTDAQAQMMVLMALTPGLSIITERIFESRFMHVSELARLGAEISIEGPSAIVKGGRKLSGAPIMASDLRASAALVIAGMAASGATQVNRIYHLDRGYEKIDVKLRRLGARIQRVQES